MLIDTLVPLATDRGQSRRPERRARPAAIVRRRRILQAGGWRGINIGPLDVPCRLTRAELAVHARRMGRIGMILPDIDDGRRGMVDAALDRAFAPYLSCGVARFDAACWIVRAQAG
ncbi:hypothetical protein [Methylobacterium oryzisoli]|uniref:hypothetical protein n=1 Tax=Methylobacterium oryzisoli TaxID=3385502 RepID=UPI00389168E8